MFGAIVGIAGSLGLGAVFVIGSLVNIAGNPWGFLAEYWLPLAILLLGIVLLIRDASRTGPSKGRRR